MAQFLLENETSLRLAFYFSILIIMALAEGAFPRRARHHSRWLRWPSNIGLVFLSSLLIRFLFPVTAAELALVMDARGVGLFHWLRLPLWLNTLASVILLDLVIYGQHVLFHRVPVLWRLHRMHHADTDYDVTTGARFHPFEILLSMGIKLLAVTALGASAVAVVIFEILLNGTAMFNHGNLKLSASVESWLRRVLVTPDFHRVHHSDIPVETHSNFGFNLPWWDYLFSTYRAQPEKGHEGMTIGLPYFRERKFLTITWLLAIPFLDKSKK